MYCDVIPWNGTTGALSLNKLMKYKFFSNNYFITQLSSFYIMNFHIMETMKTIFFIRLFKDQKLLGLLTPQLYYCYNLVIT